MPKKTEKKQADREALAEHIEEIELQKESQSDFGQIFASWQFPEFIKHERGTKWYVTFGIIILALIGISLLDFSFTFMKIGGSDFDIAFSKNPLLIIVIVLFVVLYFSLEKRGPLNVQVAITEDGILINNKFIEYEELENFYIIYYPPTVKNLYFQPRNHLKQRIIFPLEDINPAEIRQVLLEYLPEDLEKEEVPSSEGISRALKL